MFERKLLLHKDDRVTGCQAFSILTPDLIPCSPLHPPPVLSQPPLTGSEHHVLVHQRDKTDRKGRAQPQMDRKLSPLFGLAD